MSQTSQGGYFMISVILAASHEREPDQTHQGLQFTVPRGSPPAGPRGENYPQIFTCWEGVYSKIKDAQLPPKAIYSSEAEADDYRSFKTHTHIYIYILYVYIIEGTKYWNLELLNMSHPFSWGIPPWESMSHDWYPLDVFKQSWFAWFLVPSISWHLPSLLVRSYLLIYFNTF